MIIRMSGVVFTYSKKCCATRTQTANPLDKQREQIYYTQYAHLFVPTLAEQNAAISFPIFFFSFAFVARTAYFQDYNKVHVSTDSALPSKKNFRDGHSSRRRTWPT